jgi:hypothetical protein
MKESANDETEIIWKEAVVAQFMVLPKGLR